MDMPDAIEEKLNQILRDRADGAQQIEARLRSWQDIRERLVEVQEALQCLSRHPSATPGVAHLCSKLDLADLPGAIDREVLPRMRRVQQRLGRARIIIGVGGKARVGKSTLLQAISGLDNDQIPTGDDLPVTAVRSRIFHSPNQRRALLSFHTWDSFREEVLRPHYERLAWGPPPRSVAAFERAALPAVPTDAEQATVLSGLRDRVAGMQASLESYRHLMTGERREFDLEELRGFVAYPSSEQEASGRPPRRYLAVREALIECPFPGVSVRHLGLVDLPGTGEIVAAGDRRHVGGLEDEVDVVLLVTNPKKTAYWDQESANTLDIVLEARAGVEAEDFALVIVNSGGATSAQQGALKGDIERKLGGRHRIIECDAIDPGSVRQDLLEPVLMHLAARLPRMDAAAMEYAGANL
ncbi:MAG: hypothetical protein ABIO70_29925 [Pseudomonadota bacterium]